MRLFVILSLPVAKLHGGLLSVLPVPPLTMDQVELLKSDNVVADGAIGFADLDIEPTGMDVVLPHYLETYRPGGRYSVFKVG